MTELLAIIAGAVTSAIMAGLRKVLPVLNGFPKFVRSAVVLVLGIATSYVAAALGVPLPADPALWTPEIINGVLIALLAMGEHAAVKALTT